MLLTTITLLALGASLTCAASNSSGSYRKVEEYSGSHFFDGFDTYSGVDPTNGYVNYTDFNTAAYANLTAFIWREEVRASNAYVGVDYQQLRTNYTNGRKSVRLMSKNTFGVGLLTVVDVLHAPTGPGVWPAVWLLGNVTDVLWPNAGEQDIMEWVNDNTYNAATLHTAPGCTVERDPSLYQGTMIHSDCAFDQSHEACSIQAPSNVNYNGERLATAGPAFNAQGGGVYVHEWTDSGVSVWLFPRDCLPPDLANEKPDPSSWTAKPLARFTDTGCSFDQAFQQQQLIINICLCGDWAGEQGLWDSTMNKTGSATCKDYVANHPESFKDAYFEFASIKMYSNNPAAPGIAGVNKVKREEIHSGVDYNYIDGSDGLSKPYATSPASHHHHHGHLAHAHLHSHSLAPYGMTNTTVVRATGTGANHTTRRLPSSSSTARPSSGASVVEVGDFMLGLYFVLLIAAIL